MWEKLQISFCYRKVNEQLWRCRGVRHTGFGPILCPGAIALDPLLFGRNSHCFGLQKKRPPWGSYSCGHPHGISPSRYSVFSSHVKVENWSVSSLFLTRWVGSFPIMEIEGFQEPRSDLSPLISASCSDPLLLSFSNTSRWRICLTILPPEVEPDSFYFSSMGPED